MACAACGAQLRDWLGDQGIRTQRLANLLPYSSATTQVLYRPGMADAARTLARHMPAGTTIAAAAEGTTSADLRVVIGHDMRYTATCKTLAACPSAQQVAAATVGSGEQVRVR